MWSSSRPSSRRASHLAGLAVAKTSAPRCWAIWIAAMPTPPAPAWISTRSPGLQAGEVDEAVVGGEEDDRHRGGLLEGPALGDRREQRALGDRQRAEGARRSGPSPGRRAARSLDLGADLDDDAGALAADRAPRPGRGRGRPARRGS